MAVTGGEASWSRLMEGNGRFLSGAARASRESLSNIPTLLKAQAPHAAVIACSDSRVSPEIIFDAALGEIFTIRTAGQVLDRAALGSLEYAVAHLKVELVVVLGHTNCGMLAATRAPRGLETNLKWMADGIAKCLEADGSAAEDAAANVGHIAGQCKTLAQSLGFSTPVVGAIYELSSGAVGLL